VALPLLVPERCAGLRLAHELATLSRLHGRVVQPFVVLLGGRRVGEALGVIEGLLGRAQTIALGGTLAFTFLRAAGHDVGDSQVETSLLGAAAECLRNAKLRGVEILLPWDHRIVPSGGSGPRTLRTVSTSVGVGAGHRGVDIGPLTEAEYAARIARAGTVVWHGPMGLIESEDSAEGTHAIARALASAPGSTFVLGEDTFASLASSGLCAAIGHLSTGGPAALELLRGRSLPGLAALES
jgi:phosphoglycerate kinase